MKVTKGFYWSAVLVFLALLVLSLLLRAPLARRGVDPFVLAFGNLFLFALTLVTFNLHASALNSKHGPSFFRFVYGAFILKFFLTILLVVVYVIAGGRINTASLLLFMAMYFVYSFLETSYTVKATRKNNA